MGLRPKDLRLGVGLLAASPVPWPQFLSWAKKEFRAKLLSKEATHSGPSENALSRWEAGSPTGGNCVWGRAVLFFLFARVVCDRGCLQTSKGLLLPMGKGNFWPNMVLVGTVMAAIPHKVGIKTAMQMYYNEAICYCRAALIREECMLVPQGFTCSCVLGVYWEVFTNTLGSLLGSVYLPNTCFAPLASKNEYSDREVQ